jgi:hypothetical protein
MKLDSKSLMVAVVAMVLVIVATVLGSRRLSNFDPALVGYLFATIFAVGAIVYRWCVWVQRPPTSMFASRGVRLFLRPQDLPKNIVRLMGDFIDKMVLQRFIHRRGKWRGWTHMLLSWGTMAAFLIAFPLVFGWIHFELPEPQANAYVIYNFGFPVGSLPLDSALSWLAFNALNITAVVVLVGVAMAMSWRASDPGAMATQQFEQDFMPLLMLFAISTTGLMLTVSSHFMQGNFFHFFAITHEVIVILFLLYLPFGKLFHLFQRPLSLGLAVYQRAGQEGGPAICPRCGGEFLSALQISDLKVCLDKLSFDYRSNDETKPGHYQDLCPSCKRKQVAIAQRVALQQAKTKFR